jgi:hypothetical protein
VQSKYSVNTGSAITKQKPDADFIVVMVGRVRVKYLDYEMLIEAGDYGKCDGVAEGYVIVLTVPRTVFNKYLQPLRQALVECKKPMGGPVPSIPPPDPKVDSAPSSKSPSDRQKYFKRISPTQKSTLDCNKEGWNFCPVM